MEITEAVKLFEQNELYKALDILNVIMLDEPDDCQALMLRARILYKMQKWGEAMNDYALVLDFDPDNAEAKSGLEMAKSILGYFTPDMFNP